MKGGFCVSSLKFLAETGLTLTQRNGQGHGPVGGGRAESPENQASVPGAILNGIDLLS